jgi:hypothetical protein
VHGGHNGGFFPHRSGRRRIPSAGFGAGLRSRDFSFGACSLNIGPVQGIPRVGRNRRSLLQKADCFSRNFSLGGVGAANRPMLNPSTALAE